MKLTDSIDDIYMPWAKSNRRSWRNDHYNSVIPKELFGSKELREIQPLEIEKFKTKRLAAKTKHDTERAPAPARKRVLAISNGTTHARRFALAWH